MLGLYGYVSQVGLVSVCAIIQLPSLSRISKKKIAGAAWVGWVPSYFYVQQDLSQKCSAWKDFLGL